VRSVRLLVLAPLGLLLLACTSAAPGWTYAPAPPATPLPSASADASGAPSGEPSAAPSGEPSAAPSDGGGGGGTIIDIAAQNIAFDQATLSAPADQPFQIRFANNDAGIPHNVEIKDASGAAVFVGEIFNGVETRVYDVPALAAGDYPFLCTVHPNMTGTLTAS
jgi:plastocyanin